MPQRILTPAEMKRMDSLSARFYPIATTLVDEANQLCSDTDCTVLVVYGRRTHAEQMAIWKKGRTLIAGADPLLKKSWKHTGEIVTKAFPGESAHNVGEAIDLALVGPDKKWLPASDPRWSLIVGETALRLGMEWGGNWPMKDMAHVQHPKWKAARD